jgi:hypothetical protein
LKRDSKNVKIKSDPLVEYVNTQLKKW